MTIRFDFGPAEEGWIDLEVQTPLRTHYVTFSDQVDTFGLLAPALSDCVDSGEGELEFCVSDPEQTEDELERWQFRLNNNVFSLVILNPDGNRILSQEFKSFSLFIEPLLKGLKKLRLKKGAWNGSRPDRPKLEELSQLFRNDPASNAS